MAKLFLLLVFFFSLSYGFQWKYWQPALQIPRASLILQTPTANTTVFEVRGRSTAVNPSTKVLDQINFLFSSAPIPHFTVRQFDSSGNLFEQRAARLSLIKLLEFSGSVFNPDNTTILSSYPFYTATWQFSAVNQQTINNGNLYSVSATTTDGLVTITAYYSDNTTTLNLNGTTTTLDNNAIHFTVLINGYKYKQRNTKLALKVMLESETIVNDFSTVSTETDLLLQTLRATDPVRPVSVWVNTIGVVGNGCPTTAAIRRDILRSTESPLDTDLAMFTLPTETNTVTLNTPYFTYVTFATDTCQPSSIFWDPDLGIQNNISGATVSLPSLLLLVVAVCYLFLL